MNIAEVERATGLTRANIRFYEKEGLLSPARGENGYRDYAEADVRTLRKIRLLRQLRLSVPEIRAVERGEKPLPEAAERQIAVLEKDIREGEQARAVCRAICADRAEWDGLDVDKYESLAVLPVHQRGQHADDKDRLPPAGHPWRRYFARSVDLALYGLPVMLVEMRLLRFNPALLSFAGRLLEIVVTGYIAIALMLLFEPLFLSQWGTTPGKWLLGLAVRDYGGSKLSRSRAFGRTWGVFQYGFGWKIPFYEWYRGWKSYCACTEADLDWDTENECAVVVRHEETRARHVVGYLLAQALAVAATAGIVLWAELPSHRGELTLAEYVDNCNDYLAYNGYYPRVNADGSWNAQPEDGGMGLVVQLMPADRLDVRAETDADGFVSAVTVTAEGEWGCGSEARRMAYIAFAVSHERRGYLSALNDAAADLLDDGWSLGAPDTEERAQGEFGALEISHAYSYSGVSPEALEQEAPRHYLSVYTIRKK
ncbi:MAG: MerR family transcriptional regulator [Eubacteriales bacterium]|nr:MerR family transcriptional regulator [Eubacteriales bacterium]